MAVPWLKIVQLVPSILDVSRELLKRTKRMPAATAGELAVAPIDELGPRVAALEENERRQAELINQMAEQNAALARAVTTLHSRLTKLSIVTVILGIVAVVALIVAAR